MENTDKAEQEEKARVAHAADQSVFVATEAAKLAKYFAGLMDAGTTVDVLQLVVKHLELDEFVKFPEDN